MGGLRIGLHDRKLAMYARLSCWGSGIADQGRDWPIVSSNISCSTKKGMWWDWNNDVTAVVS